MSQFSIGSIINVLIGSAKYEDKFSHFKIVAVFKPSKMKENETMKKSNKKQCLKVKNIITFEV